MPRPQLQLVLFNLSGERINPTAPTVLGFPLDTRSKKIVAFEVPCHHIRESFLVRHKCQVGTFIGLLIDSFLTPDRQGASHAETSAVRVKAEFELFTISNKRAFTLAATSTEFGSLL